jgi:hypothetical protein
VDSLPLIVAGIVVPLMAFVGNIVLRAGRGVAQSAASDLLLLVLVFDASVVIASDEFRPLIRDAAISAQLVAIHVGLWWLGLVAWLLAVLRAETKIAASFDPRSKRYDSRFPIWTWLFSWVLAMAIVFLQVSVFTQEVPRWAMSSPPQP